MILELLGSRVLSPVFGASLFVWSSIISVTLLSLAVGYYAGGRVADRKDTYLLFAALSWTAIAVAAIPLLARMVLPMTDSMGIRAGSLAAALLLFGIPLALLAAASPIAIKIIATGFETVGAVAGVVSAVGTLGAVSATLLTGFLLLPMFGARALLSGLSLGLGLIATLIAIYTRTSKAVTARHYLALWLVVALLVALTHIVSRPGHRFKALFSRTTLDGMVQVVEEPDRGLRWMLVDGSAISVQRTTSGKTILPYLAIFESIIHFRPGGNRALVVGLGSGHLVGRLSARGIAVDAIEINRDVVRAAREHFSLIPPGRILVGDARRELRELGGAGESYDFILHDCFTGGTMPVHLLTREALEEAAALLGPKGVLALNFFGETGGESVARVGSTLRSVFPFIRLFLPARGQELIDHVFVASRSELAFPEKQGGAGASPELVRAAYHLRGLESSMDVDRGAVVTDDRNPLELVQATSAERYRKKIIDRFGLALFIE